MYVNIYNANGLAVVLICLVYAIEECILLIYVSQNDMQHITLLKDCLFHIQVYLKETAILLLFKGIKQIKRD